MCKSSIKLATVEELEKGSLVNINLGKGKTYHIFDIYFKL